MRQSSVISRGLGSMVQKNTLTNGMNQFGDNLRDVRVEVEEYDNDLQDNNGISNHLRNDYHPGQFADFRHDYM